MYRQQREQELSQRQQQPSSPTSLLAGTTAASPTQGGTKVRELDAEAGVEAGVHGAQVGAAAATAVQAKVGGGTPVLINMLVADENFDMAVALEDTVAAVKALIEVERMIPRDYQVLLYPAEGAAAERAPSLRRPLTAHALAS